MSQEFLQGMRDRQMGYSIHWNPYRHNGTSKQFTEWEAGWHRQDVVERF